MGQLALFLKSLPMAFQEVELGWLRFGKRKALAFCIAVTLGVMGVELVFSRLTNSLMLFSDGLHMLTHALSLGVTLVALVLASRGAAAGQAPGQSKIELAAAILNGLGLAFFTLYIVYESVLRFSDLTSLRVDQTLAVAIIGLLVNLLTALVLYRAGIEDLNTKSAYLHLLADTFSSVAIIVGCVVIYYTNWLFIDPLLSLVVAFIIGKWSYGLLREAFWRVRQPG